MDNLKGPQPDTSSLINTRAGRNLRDPLDYSHPYGSMRQFAQLLALRHDSTRTRHSYYRAMRLVHEHFGADPATLGEDQFRGRFDVLSGFKSEEHRVEAFPL